MDGPKILSPGKLERVIGDSDSAEHDDLTDKLTEMHEQLDQHPGTKYRELISDLARAKQILDDNYSELLSSLDHFEQNPGSFASSGLDIQDALLDFTRKLHNYLASCLTLRDHTYRVKQKLEKEDLDEQYSEKLQSTGFAMWSDFIGDLRNYVQHRRIPVTTGDLETSLRAGETAKRSSKILIEKSQLLEWGSWKENSRNVLKNLNRNLRFGTLWKNTNRKQLNSPNGLETTLLVSILRRFRREMSYYSRWQRSRSD